MTDEKIRVHCMGIGGSGMSAAASLAKSGGYNVDGCDLESTTPYMKVLKGIDVKHGHSKEHVEDSDILLVSPAIYFNKDKPEELKSARNVMTWQKFVGQYLMRGKDVIAVAGTHGKSTTTAMLSLAFEAAKKDPSAVVGAKVSDWESNYRYGKGENFIIEADEFFDSFLNYRPDAAIINNIEFDHPDFFKDQKQMFASYKKFIKRLAGRKILIYNMDSENLSKLVANLDTGGIRFVSYSTKDKSTDVFGQIVARSKNGTKFRVVSEKLDINEDFEIRLTGDFNVSNSLGVIAMASLYSIKPAEVKESLKTFHGVSRRIEVLGKRKGVYVYDDYAHHPTEIRSTLSALRQKHPRSKIFAVVEPHSYSRTKALLRDYKGVFSDAGEVIVAPIFKARDTETFGVSEESIVKISGHKNIQYMDSFEKIVEYLAGSARRGNVIIVMGAGKSHEISRKLLA